MVDKSSPPGLAFQRTTEALERCLSKTENIRFESNKRLIDVRTGQKREHDIVVTYSERHREFLMAIECRDRSRPVGSPQIEAFYQKCIDTRVEKKVIVSSSGYYKSALVKATALGIECLTIENIASYPWISEGNFSFTNRRLVHTKIRFRLEIDPSIILDDFVVKNEDGVEITPELIQANISKVLRDRFAELPDSRFEEKETLWNTKLAKINFEAEGCIAFDNKTGATYKVKDILTESHYENDEKTLPVQLKRYEKAESGDQITQAAIASIDEENLKGDIVIVHDEQNGSTIHWVPRATTKT